MKTEETTPFEPGDTITTGLQGMQVVPKTPSRCRDARKIWIQPLTLVDQMTEDYFVIHGKNEESWRTLVFESLPAVGENVNAPWAITCVLHNAGRSYDQIAADYKEALVGPKGGQRLGNPQLRRNAWQAIAVAYHQTIREQWADLRARLDNVREDEPIDDHLCEKLTAFAYEHGDASFFEEYRDLAQELVALTNLAPSIVWASMIQLPHDINKAVVYGEPIGDQAVGMPYIKIPDPVIRIGTDGRIKETVEVREVEETD